jgi:hypothetical protein
MIEILYTFSSMQIKLLTRVLFPALRDFSLLRSVKTASGAYRASYPMGIGGSFLRGKAVGALSSLLTSI